MTKYVLVPIFQGPGPLTIGCAKLTGSYFKGRIDEVRIYNRALEPGEVAIDGGVAIQTPAAAPIAAYPLDENTGTLAHDTSGGLHDGTFSAEGVSWAPGKYGSALQFDGANGCVSIPDSLGLQLGEEFSLESWVKPEGELTQLPILYKAGEGFPAYDLGIGLSTVGRGEGQIGTLAKGHGDVASEDALEAGVWQHLAVSWDGAKLRLYLNGELAATKAVSEPNSGAAGELSIGCGGGYHFRGRIDDLRIYNRAIGLGEVSADMVAAIQTPQIGPIAAYPFEEGEGAVASDYVGGHEGALSAEGVKWAEGKYGSGLKFEGSEGCVTIPDSTDLQLREEFTLESWVKPEGAMLHYPAIYKESTEGFPSYSLGIGFNTAGKPEGQIGKQGKAHQDIAGSSSLEAGVWSHLALTYDGVKLRLYINGELVATKYVDKPNSSTPGPLTIGCSALGAQHFKGRIDEVRIYNRALSPAEVLAGLGPLPYVKTMEAYGAEAGEAVLAGTINPEGDEARYRFEYGLTASYGKSTPEPPEVSEEVVGGNVPVEIEEVAEGLEPETTYHYRIVAVNNHGTVAGRDLLMKTPPEPTGLQKLAEERHKLRTSKEGSGFFNLNWNGNPIKTADEKTAEMLFASGAKMFRVPVGNVDQQTDRLFEYEAQRGVTVLPNVVGVPGFSGERLIPSMKEGTPSREAWETKLRAVVKRYGQGGTFWAEPAHKALKEKHVEPEWWEIWNEENYGPTGTEGPNGSNEANPVRYGELLEVSHRVIHQLQETKLVSEAKIMVGGLLTVGMKGTVPHMAVNEFIRRMKHGDDYGAISLHPYAFGGLQQGAHLKGETPVAHVTKQVKINIKKGRAALDRVGGKEKKIWITEIGWPVKGDGAEEDGSHHLVDEETQRQLLNSVFGMLKEYSGASRGSFNIKNAFFYNIQDNTAPNGERPRIVKKFRNWANHCGLREDGSGLSEQGKYRKGAWQAFQEQAEAPKVGAEP